MPSCVCVNNLGARRFVPDKFVFGVLDYYFAVRFWGWVLGFWAWDEFWGRNVTDSIFTSHFQSYRFTGFETWSLKEHLEPSSHGCLGFLQKPTVQACILPKSSINHSPQPNRVSHKISWKSNHAAMFLTYSFCLQKAITQVGAKNIQYWRIQRDTTKHIWLVGSGIHMKIMHWCHITDIANASF